VNKPLLKHVQKMRLAFEQALKAQKRGEVPVGAILVRDGQVIAQGYNLTRRDNDPLGHAEIVVIRKATKKLKNERLRGTILYVTLEPCAMCAGAIIQARIDCVVFGASDPKAGACGSVLRVLGHPKLNHHPQIAQGILAQKCGSLLKIFFKSKRHPTPKLRNGR